MNAASSGATGARPEAMRAELHDQRLLPVAVPVVVLAGAVLTAFVVHPNAVVGLQVSEHKAAAVQVQHDGPRRCGAGGG